MQEIRLEGIRGVPEARRGIFYVVIISHEVKPGRTLEFQDKGEAEQAAERIRQGILERGL